MRKLSLLPVGLDPREPHSTLQTLLLPGGVFGYFCLSLWKQNQLKQVLPWLHLHKGGDILASQWDARQRLASPKGAAIAVCDSRPTGLHRVLQLSDLLAMSLDICKPECSTPVLRPWKSQLCRVTPQQAGEGRRKRLETFKAWQLMTNQKKKR